MDKKEFTGTELLHLANTGQIRDDEHFYTAKFPRYLFIYNGEWRAGEQTEFLNDFWIFDKEIGCSTDGCLADLISAHKIDMDKIMFSKYRGTETFEEKVTINRKELRNYIFNELGISKVDIQNLIRKEINKIVSEETEKVMHDKKYIENLVEKELIRQLKINDNNRRSYLVCTMNAIYNKIDETIHNEVKKRLIIDLKPESDEEE